jgi:hypothetical protein
MDGMRRDYFSNLGGNYQDVKFPDFCATSRFDDNG